MRLKLKEKNNNFTKLKLNYKLLTETKVFPYPITVRDLFLSSHNVLSPKTLHSVP